MLLKKAHTNGVEVSHGKANLSNFSKTPLKAAGVGRRSAEARTTLLFESVYGLVPSQQVATPVCPSYPSLMKHPMPVLPDPDVMGYNGVGVFCCAFAWRHVVFVVCEMKERSRQAKHLHQSRV